MPSGSITSTTNTFGMIPGTLTGSVGVPGPQGPTGPTGATGATGPAGPGVATGGTAGQYLTKVDGTNYNTNWTTLDLSTYAPLASPAFTGNPTAPTATFGDNDTSISTTAFVQAALAGGTAVAKNLEVYVRNQTGSTIPAGRIVYISGATGNRPLISLAQANNDANSAQTMGFTKESIANNGFGYVIVRGELENIDTSALTEGVQLYLSPTTAGTWTTTKPSAPQHLVYVGIVVRSHPTLGVILVAVQNGYEIGELHDVSITSPSNGQVLKYDSATSLWKNSEDSAPVTSVAGKTGAVTLAVADVSGAAALASPTFTGTPAAPTAAANTNTTQVATTAFVVGQAASSNPLVDGTAAVGTSLRYARQDHVHPTDTTRAPLASPTFTGTVTIPAGASISGYLTTSSAASTYQTQSGMSDYLAKSGNLSGLSSTSTARTNLGLGSLATVNDAPADGSQYARKNNAWEVVSGGGGFSGGTVTSPIQYFGTNANVTFGDSLSTYQLVISDSTSNRFNYSGSGGINMNEVSTSLVLAFGVDYSGVSLTGSGLKYAVNGAEFTENGINLGIVTSGINYGKTIIYFPDSTQQNTAGIPEAPNDGNYYVRKNGAWYQCTVVSIYDSNTSTSYNCLTV